MEKTWMCERLPEERREDRKEKTNDDKSRLFEFL